MRASSCLSGSNPGRRVAAGLLIFRVDDQMPAHAFAFALSVQVGFVAQGEMNDAALARGHRREVIRRAGPAHLLGGNISRHAQLLNPHRAVILAIKRNFLVFAGGQAEHFEGEQFEGAEKFAATIEQQSGIGPGEVDKDFRLFPVAVLGQRRIDDDTILEVQSAVRDNGLQEFINLVSGGNFVGYGHEFSSQPPASDWTAWSSKWAIPELAGLKPEYLSAPYAAVSLRSYMLLARRNSRVNCWFIRISAERRQMTANHHLSFFRARFSIISRISRPSAVRFMTACWPMLIRFTTA